VSINLHALYQRYLQVGAEAASTPEEAKELARLLYDEPVYRDPMHPDHRIVAADIRHLYAQAHPEPQHAAPVERRQAEAVIAQLLPSEAYSNSSHPNHAATVAQVASAYAVVHRGEGGA
jgi:hypothetical protein